MPIYTLCSTDCDNYGEIIVSIPFYNSEKIVEVTVLSICTLFNVELLGENDFIDVQVGGLVHHVTATATAGLEGIEEELGRWFESAGLPNMAITRTGRHTLLFAYSQDFTILNMSYNFKMATGFYYLNDKNNFPIRAVEKEENNWQIEVRACPFSVSTPVLYLLSNTGGNCYRMNLTDDTMQTGTISMIINNSFTSGMPAIYQQADITTKCYSSDLTLMRITLCDSNLRTLKLLNPLFVTLSINDVAEALFS
jgi:hypothetical protein